MLHVTLEWLIVCLFKYIFIIQGLNYSVCNLCTDAFLVHCPFALSNNYQFVQPCTVRIYIYISAVCFLCILIHRRVKQRVLKIKCINKMTIEVVLTHLQKLALFKEVAKIMSNLLFCCCIGLRMIQKYFILRV